MLLGEQSVLPLFCLFEFNYPKILFQNIAERDDASIVDSAGIISRNRPLKRDFLQQKIIRVLKEYFKNILNV